MAETPPPNVNAALPGVSIINLLLGSIAAIVVALRLYTRLWIKPSAGWDDILIVLALVFGITYTVGQLVQVYDGHYGHHKAYLTPGDWILIWKWNAVVNTILPVSTFCSRASICFFLLRLLRTIRRWRNALYFALVLNLCVCVGTILMYALECVPISREWNSDETKGFCINREAFDIVVKFFSALNCVVDFMCAGIPFAAMQTVRLDRKTRYGLYAILCCGIVTAACSIGRAVSLDFKSPDPTYKLVPLSYWTAAEMYGAIIFASLPALRQLGSLVKRKALGEGEEEKRKRMFGHRKSRSQQAAEPQATTAWTYSPDSGGFGSFMHSAGHTTYGAGTPGTTRVARDEGPLVIDEMLDPVQEEPRESTQLSQTATQSTFATKKRQSHQTVELSQLERGESSRNAVDDDDDDESLDRAQHSNTSR